jgi:hypothetical protein
MTPGYRRPGSVSAAEAVHIVGGGVLAGGVFVAVAAFFLENAIVRQASRLL